MPPYAVLEPATPRECVRFVSTFFTVPSITSYSTYKLGAGPSGHNEVRLFTQLPSPLPESALSMPSTTNGLDNAWAYHKTNGAYKKATWYKTKEKPM